MQTGGILKINKEINNDLEVAHPQSGSSSTWFLVALELGHIGFCGEGKPRVPEKKLSEEWALYTKRSHGAKQTTLLDSKQRRGILKGKGVSFLDDALAHCVVYHLIRCFCSMWPFHAKGPYFNKMPIWYKHCRYGSDTVCFSHIKIRIGKLTRDYQSLTQSSSFRDYTSW